MSFETLKEHIVGEATSRAQEITERYSALAKESEQRILARARELEEAIIRDAESEGVRRAARMKQDADLRARAAVLSAKQEELDATKEAFKQQLLEADKESTDNLLKALLSLLPDVKGTLIAGAEHADRLAKLAPRGVTIGSKHIPNEGGFIFQSKGSELNATVSHLVDQIFSMHRSEIAKELFS